MSVVLVHDSQSPSCLQNRIPEVDWNDTIGLAQHVDQRSA